jgi:fumarylacetoacetate (FAA) hydrolase
MKLATYRNHQPDGCLMVVARDGLTAAPATGIAANLLDAVQRWAEAAPALEQLSRQLNAGDCAMAVAFDPARCMAPLPRTFQWCDGSAFLNHGRLMQQAFKVEAMPDEATVPLMYQGASDDFLGPCDDVPMPDEALGIDFEGEYGVILDRVEMGAAPAQALQRVLLLVQINDWSLRSLGPREMRSGFGFLQAKPSTSFAPLAITPDELAEDWRDGRVHLPLHVEWNGAWFGHPDGGGMDFDFGQLIAHAARTRRLGAGTIIGSGTVSSAQPGAGSACIAERRVIEIIGQGAAHTGFMRFGDRVRMQARTARGEAPFGAIDQCVTGEQHA